MAVQTGHVAGDEACKQEEGLADLHFGRKESR